MKRIFSFFITAAIVFAAQAQFNLGDILNGLGSKSDDDNNISNAISGLLGGVLSTDRLSLSDLQGSWSYNEPAVCFKSENLLKKAGGTAAAQAVENKLTPYYKLTGLDKVKLTVNSDSTFVMTVRTIKLNGTIEILDDKDSESNVIFHFRALKKINLGSMNSYVVKGVGGKSIDVMFDISKLVTIADKVSGLTKSSSVKTAVNLLKSYDGLCAGFGLGKDNTATK